MATAEIERLAASGAEMPLLGDAEQLLFLRLRVLYHSFKTGVISKEQGTREKADIIKQYHSNLWLYEMAWELAGLRNRLSHQLTEIVKSGCPMCRKAVAIFDGIDKGTAEQERLKRQNRNG